MLLALIVRVVVLPWSQTIHADAVSRVFSASDWLVKPYYIIHGYWGPLHHYLTAFALWIMPNQVVAPKLLNILLASFSILPLYGFTKNLFGNRLGAVFVSLVYGLSPVIMHNSFQALSDVSYAFFVLCSMYFLSEGFKQDGKIRYAILAGFVISLAAATRYESWVIIAAFTLVGVLHKQWKFTAVFWSIAVLFPFSWMIGNHIEYGDFLYSSTLNDIGNIEKQGINDNVDNLLRIRRIIFFPFSFIVNVSPIASILILITIAVSIFKKSISKSQLIWLLPFLILSAVFLQKTYTGTLMMQHRFIITWIVLLLPFLALAFNNTSRTKLKTVLLTLAVVSLIPMSFYWGWIDYTSYFGKGTFGQALNRMNAEQSHEFEAIPTLTDTKADSLIDCILANSKPKDGLVLDFFGWEKTYYTALNVNTRGIVVGGMKNSTLGHQLIYQHLTNHPSGLIVLSRRGKLLKEAVFRDSLFYIKHIDKPILLTELYSTQGEKLFRYDVLEQVDSHRFVQSQPAIVSLFGTKKDIAYYEVAIRSNLNWYRRLQREGYWKGESIDTTLAKNARYMVLMESKKK